MTAPAADAVARFRTSFPLVDAKLHPHSPPPGTVPRDRLVRRLLAADGPAVVSLIAPPGYGKSTLLAQWVARETRPVAWLTLDALDNDPAILLAYLGRARLPGLEDRGSGSSRRPCRAFSRSSTTGPLPGSSSSTTRTA